MRAGSALHRCASYASAALVHLLITALTIIGLLRVDPKTRYFGGRIHSGTVRTFFRPDEDPVAYLWGQL